MKPLLGTLAPREGGDTGNLYSIENDRVTKVDHGIIISNGLAFNTELKKMYYIDSHKKTVDEFDFDVEHGTVGMC